MANNNDYIFGRLENEMKQIEEQKRRNAQRVKESEQHWLVRILKKIGNAISGALAFLLEKIFGSGK